MAKAVDILQIPLIKNLGIWIDFCRDDVGRLIEDWGFELGMLRLLHL